MGGFSKNLVGGWGGKLAIPGLRPCGGDMQISWNRNGGPNVRNMKPKELAGIEALKKNKWVRRFKN